MLENDMQELNNDYVTLWSKYVLTNDYNSISKDIEALAEMGQIDAIEKFYLHNDEENPIVDYQVKTNKGNDYNVNFIKGIYKINKHSDSYEKLYNRALGIYKNFKIIEDSPVHRYLGGAVYTQSQEQLMSKLREKMKLYFDLLRKVDGYCFVARKKVDDALKEDKNPILIHKKAEITSQLANLALLPATREKYQKESEKLAKEAMTKLYKEYKNLVKSKQEVDPSLALALAGYYINSKNPTNRTIARALLSNYADRELSTRLKEYKALKENSAVNNTVSKKAKTEPSGEQVK